MSIIGLSGLAGSGKDTVCSILIDIFLEKHNILFVRKAYADILKNKIMLDFDLSYEQLYGDLKSAPDIRYPKKSSNISVPDFTLYEDGRIKEESFWTPREIMQYIGTDCYRAIDKNFWIKALYKDYTEDSNWIIADCRFEDEVDAVINRDGIHIHIDRDITLVNNHISENKKLINYKVDYVINNNMPMDNLIQELVLLSDELIKNM